MRKPLRGTKKRGKPDGVRVGAVFVPIYKIRDGRYQIAYRTGGKRKIETYKTHAAAKGGAETAATTLNNSGTEGFIFTAADRAVYAQALIDAGKYDLGVMDAMMEWTAARQKAGRHPLQRIIDLGLEALACAEKTSAQVLEELLISKRAAEVEVRYLRGLTDDLTEFCKAHPGNIITIRAGDIEAWLNGLAVGARRRNNIRSEIVTLFRFAKDRGYLPEARRTEPEKVAKKRDRGRGAVNVFTPEEMLRILNLITLGKPADEENRAIAPRLELLPWIALGGFAGIRTEEICPIKESHKDMLRWEDFNWKKRFITIRPEVSKTGEKRLVPICDSLFAWLRPFHAAEGPVFEKSRIDNAGRWIKKHTGIKEFRNALRHSYGTYRMAIIKNMPQLAYEMGNSIAIIRRHYHEARHEDEGLAWFAVWPEWPNNVIQTTFNLAG